MNRSIKSHIKQIGKFASFIYPYNFCKKVDKLRDLLYTGLKMRFFSSFGTESIVCYKSTHLEGLNYISVGKHTRLGRNIQLTAINRFQSEEFTPSITIGDCCCIRDNSHITAINKISIGNNVLTGTNVLITDNAHGNTIFEHMSLRPELRPLVSKGPVVIGNNVWIGNNVCIMPGVNIGDNTIVGANSVVTKEIPANCMAAGIPANIIKQL